MITTVCEDDLLDAVPAVLLVLVAGVGAGLRDGEGGQLLGDGSFVDLVLPVLGTASGNMNYISECRMKSFWSPKLYGF